MKKIQKLLVVTLALLLSSIANALEIIDVRADHWAGQEIVRAIQNGYIYVVGGNKFVPQGTMTRSEFVTALLKVIRRQNEDVVQKTTFKDIDSLTPNKRDSFSSLFSLRIFTFHFWVNIEPKATLKSKIESRTNFVINRFI